MTSPDSKTILLTGTSSGFGNLSARALLDQGYRVLASMRETTGRNQEAADALRAFAAQHGHEVHILDIDVTDLASIERGVAEALQLVGRIDVLINNAGQAYLGPFEGFSDAQLRAQFEVNFFGAASMARAVLPAMRAEGKGLMIHVSSGLGRATFPGTGVYSATKYALEAMSEAIRYEASMFGVDSILVEPGAFDTGIVNKMVAPEQTDVAAAYGPLANAIEMWEQSLGEYFASGGGKPEDVVDVMTTLIESEPGKRPTRIAVGGDVAFVQEANEATLPYTRQGFEAFGMSDFLPLVQ
jgi:NAD(P)-dependent dehydrogenase (short-subunit alcohol dehydrogenase family)